MIIKLREKIKNIFRNRKGGSEIIGLALILLFVLLAAAPKIKDLGNTTSNAIESLDSNLNQTLSE